jgi:hypothetical protein
MPARKQRRRSKKVTSRKPTPAKKSVMADRKVARSKKEAAKELVLGPLERAGESIADAARRLWLSAESLVASRGGSGRKGKAKTSDR